MCGGGGGGADMTEQEKEAQKKAERELEAQARADEKPVKMLLLGAGESGKSTIFKQMKVINKSGYTDKEKMEFKSIVHSNVLASMKSLLDSFEKLNETPPDDVKAIHEDFKTQTANGDTNLTPELYKLVSDLWGNAAIQKQFERRSEFQLNDSAEYYFNNLERIGQDNYLPSTDDVLRSRVRTTGIVQSDFQIKDLQFAMFDVGGQRNERRKWIHCFDNVDAVVFVAALSEFDQVLFEDETQNRVDEAVSLFDQIVNSKWFKETSMILFLNKKDLFEQKLKSKVFAEFVNKNESREPYSGANELGPCSEYFKKIMLDKRKDKDKSVFTHITTAIDTSNVKFVFNAVVAMILEANLKSSGLA